MKNVVKASIISSGSKDISVFSPLVSLLLPFVHGVFQQLLVQRSSQQSSSGASGNMQP